MKIPPMSPNHDQRPASRRRVLPQPGRAAAVGATVVVIGLIGTPADAHQYCHSCVDTHDQDSQNVNGCWNYQFHDAAPIFGDADGMYAQLAATSVGIGAVNCGHVGARVAGYSVDGNGQPDDFHVAETTPWNYDLDYTYSWGIETVELHGRAPYNSQHYWWHNGPGSARTDNFKA